MLFFWQEPRHLGRHLVYGLVTIDPAIFYRITARIASTLYRTKASLLGTFRYDPIAARAMGMATVYSAAFIVYRHNINHRTLAVH